jgi:hypothetical protein
LKIINANGVRTRKPTTIRSNVIARDEGFQRPANGIPVF